LRKEIQRDYPHFFDPGRAGLLLELFYNVEKYLVDEIGRIRGSGIVERAGKHLLSRRVLEWKV